MSQKMYLLTASSVLLYTIGCFSSAQAARTQVDWISEVVADKVPRCTSLEIECRITLFWINIL